MLVKKGKYKDDDVPPLGFATYCYGVLLQRRAKGWCVKSWRRYVAHRNVSLGVALDAVKQSVERKV